MAGRNAPSGLCDFLDDTSFLSDPCGAGDDNGGKHQRNHRQVDQLDSAPTIPGRKITVRQRFQQGHPPGQTQPDRINHHPQQQSHHLHPRRPQDHPADRQLAGQEKDKKGEQEEDKYIPE